MKRIASAIPLVLCATCAAAPKPKVSPAKPNLIAGAHDRVKEVLKDPESARFRSDFVGKDGAVCGFVNSKNSYGGYDGFKRYIVRPDNVLIEYDESRTWIVDARWLESCADFEPAQ